MIILNNFNHSKFAFDKRYYNADKALVSLFNSFPENKKLEDIVRKIEETKSLVDTALMVWQSIMKNTNFEYINHNKNYGK